MIDQVLKHLVQLVGFNTSNPPRAIDADSAIVEYLRNVLEPLGFDVRVDDYQHGHVNIYAKRGQPSVLFNVHLDTVPSSSGWKRNPFQLSVENSKAYGLGACVIKGAAACLLSLAQVLRDQPMALLFSTDEEGANGCCIKEFCKDPELMAYEQVVVAEPTQCSAVLAHRGYMSVRGEFVGVAGHSSEPRALKDNALHKVCGWASGALSLAEVEQSVEHGGYAGICLNVGTVDGGIKSNVIADKASIKWSARLRPMDDVEDWYQRLCAVDSDPSTQWQRPFNGPPLPASNDHMLHSKQFAERFNIPVANGVNFWTEASLFSEAGIPALVLGSGNIEQAHCADEWVSLAQLELLHKYYHRIIKGRDYV